MSLLRESSAITTHKSQIISQTYVYTILWHYCFAKKLTMDQQKMEKSNCITLRILTSPLSVSKGSLMNAQIQSSYVSHNSYSQIISNYAVSAVIQPGICIFLHPTLQLLVGTIVMVVERKTESEMLMKICICMLLCNFWLASNHTVQNYEDNELSSQLTNTRKHKSSHPVNWDYTWQLQDCKNCLHLNWFTQVIWKDLPLFYYCIKKHVGTLN